MPENPPVGPAARRVLLTGASRGIGRAIADLLAPDVELVLTVRRPEEVQPLQQRLPDAEVLPLDLGTPEAMAEGCAGLADVDAVVHCAGVQGSAAAADLDPGLVSSVLGVNLAGPVELTRLLLPGLRRTRGQVVLVNSTAALRTFPGWAAYSASKAALRAYADALREEERVHGIRVSTVFPGRTDTGMQREIAAKAGRRFDPSTALRPERVAEVVRYVLTAPDDAEITELTISPAPRG